MPIRNPFNRRTLMPHDENAGSEISPTFERVDTFGSKASSFLSIRSARSQDTGEYKMSVVNDSGVYLPPSPTEEKSQWPGRYLSSRKSSDTDARSSQGDLEPFSMSRESFDSYRRSFDISARSPVITHVPARQSLDSAPLARSPRAPTDGSKAHHQSLPVADDFEDVALDDNKQQAPRKRNFFTKLGETQERFMPGRKRAQSGQDSELRDLGRI
ncbi:hypothetical protein CDD81_2144 [Ophiocordyceps australis]|uniref:Uncharacterized protein n=1 Tax=Ophiocordyceps australis TaxID=1399860 RepID=A0A2C5XEV6_9HYPO|nr:hypothetical protein CDD81_2144 [Ophiocordyceps australis]